MFDLRDYQHEAIDAVHAAALSHDRVVVVLPTGSGKTVIFSHLASQWLERSAAPVLILVHRDELVRQTVAKLNAIIPGITTGVVKAARNEVNAQVIVASVQTLARGSRLADLPAVSLVIVDEAHHAAADSYLTVLRHVGALGDARPARAYAVGFTATLMRADDKGLADVWQKVVYQRSIIQMITDGHLVDVTGLSVPTNLDLDKVKRSAGDWQAGDLADELEVAMVPAAVADAYAEHAADRTGVLFAPTVESAHSFADALNAKGIRAETVHGDMPTEDRQLIYKRLRHGETRVVTNCMVLTEGWDEPSVSCCVIARPTSSTGLYIQMVGRVLRPWEPGGKTSALVLDATGASRKHSLTDLGALLPSGKKPEPGVTLLEQFAEGQTDTAARRRLVELSVMEQVDLFAKSKSLWLQTDGGVWFVPCGDGLIFLVETEDGYIVGRHTREFGARRVTSDPVPVELAMAVGEREAMNWDQGIASKTASWRRRKEDATPRQISYLGDLYQPGMTKRDASNAISVKIASKILKKFATTTQG